MQQDSKDEIQHVPDVDHQEGVDDKMDDKLSPVGLQAQSSDRLSVWQAAKMYRKVGLFCFLAAFSASMDGYQGSFHGSIVSNKGFIRQFRTNPTATVLDGKWVGIWGGIASMAQTLSQFGVVFVSDRFGRRVTLWCTWIILVAVSLCC